MAYLIARDATPGDVQFPWEHECVNDLPPRLREPLDQAHVFSEAVHGSQLLYNLMLAQLAGDDELTQRYREEIAGWRELMKSRRTILKSWDRQRFWEIVHATGARITHPTRLFVDVWLDLVVGDPGVDVSEHASARTMIVNRERYLKRGQARVDNRRALELWGGESGAAQLDYRWRSARRILSDLDDGRHAQVGNA